MVGETTTVIRNALVACGLAVAAAGAAAAWPERPLRVVVPYAPGGSTDTVARLVGARLSERLGQQLVLDNRTGAGTLIGTEIVARSAPDGYTLLMATPPLAVNPTLYGKVPHNLERDFVAVTNVAGSSNLLVVHPSLNVATTRAWSAC
jgi:tripartite-type tricarboxylate transporter receptor subunit TctC